MKRKFDGRAFEQKELLNHTRLPHVPLYMYVYIYTHVFVWWNVNDPSSHQGVRFYEPASNQRIFIWIFLWPYVRFKPMSIWLFEILFSSYTAAEKSLCSNHLCIAPCTFICICVYGYVLLIFYSAIFLLLSRECQDIEKRAGAERRTRMGAPKKKDQRERGRIFFFFFSTIFFLNNIFIYSVCVCICWVVKESQRDFFFQFHLLYCQCAKDFFILIEEKKIDWVI